MGESTTVHIEGLDTIFQKLIEMPDNERRKILRRAANAGAIVFRDEARQRAPKYEKEIKEKDHPPAGTLKRSIVTKYIAKDSDRFNATYYVTVRRGKKYQKQGIRGDKSQDAFYAQFVEYGTQKMAARPFMRPAFEAKKKQAAELVTEKIIEGVIQYIVEHPEKGI